MADVLLKDIPSVASVASDNKIPISQNDNIAHSVTLQTLKKYMNEGVVNNVTWEMIEGKPIIPSKTSELVNDKEFISKPRVISFKDGENIAVKDNVIYRQNGNITNIQLEWGEDLIVGSRMYFTAQNNTRITIHPTFTKIGDFENIKGGKNYIIYFNINFAEIAEEGVGGEMNLVEIKEPTLDLDAVRDNTYYNLYEMDRIEFKKIENCEKGSMMVFTANKGFQLVLPRQQMIKIGDFENFVERCRYILTFQNNVVAITKDGIGDNNFIFANMEKDRNGGILTDVEIAEVKPNFFYKFFPTLKKLNVTGFSPFYSISVMEINVTDTIPQITIADKFFKVGDLREITTYCRVLLIFMRDNCIIKILK